MPLGELSERLLREHARRRGQLFYAIEILDPMMRDSDLAQLDASYRELVDANLMESSGAVVSFFGSPKVLYRLTAAGAERAQQQPAA